MGRLTTHVLDTSRGKPASGVRIELAIIEETNRRVLRSGTTNSDGRTDEPLLSRSSIETGVYELTFHAGEYFRANGVEITDPPFLDDVVIRFGIADATANYHVPLLLAPYGYSTYRGS